MSPMSPRTRVGLMGDMTRRSKHSVMMGVSATGQSPLRRDGGDFFGTGATAVALKHDGAMARSREVVKTSFSSFSTPPGTLSGPAALPLNRSSGG